MDNKVQKQKNYDRTAEWNSAGYTGRNIIVWNMEPQSDHGTMTRQRILDAAPNAVVINRPWTLKFNSSRLIYEKVYDPVSGENLSLTEFVTKYKPTVFTASLAGGSEKKYPFICSVLTQLQAKYKIAMLNAAGNYGSKGVQKCFLPPENAMYIGSCMMYKDNPNDIRMCTYSSIGDEFEEVDFSSWTGSAGVNGTSFSAPYIAGICALLQQRYAGITPQEIYQYLKMVSQPIDTGHNIKDKYDAWSGYGIPILPKVDKKLVRMQINNTEYKIDNEAYKMDSAPIIYLQRTYVPIAFVALALNAKVAWNEKDKSVTIMRSGRVVQMWIQSKFYKINGASYHMDAEPFIKNRRTLVPIAVVAEALNCKVAWVANMQEVMILEG